MRKPTRAVLIVAIALLIIGGSLTAIGSAMGGGMRNWPGSATRWINFNGLNWGRSIKLSSESAELDPFTAIRTDTDIGKITIHYGDSYHVDFIECPMEYTSWSLVDGILTIRQAGFDYDDHNWGNYNDRNTEIRVTVPRDIVLSGLDINHDLGELVCEVPVKGDRVNIDLDLGSATVRDIIANNVTIDLDLGSLTASNITADRFSAKLDLGDANLRGIAACHVVANCSLGNLDLQLIGNLDDYNYELDTNLGSLTLDGSSVRGGHINYHVSGRPYNLNISVDLGRANVSFMSPGSTDPFAALPAADSPSGDMPADSSAPTEGGRVSTPDDSAPAEGAPPSASSAPAPQSV